MPVTSSDSLHGGSRIGKTAQQRFTAVAELVPKPGATPGEHKATLRHAITQAQYPAAFAKGETFKSPSPPLQTEAGQPISWHAAGAQTSSFPRQIWVVWQIHRGAAFLCPPHSPSPPNRCRQSEGWYCNQSRVNVHMLKGFRLTPTVPSPHPREKQPPPRPVRAEGSSVRSVHSYIKCRAAGHQHEPGVTNGPSPICAAPAPGQQMKN